MILCWSEGLLLRGTKCSVVMNVIEKTGLMEAAVKAVRSLMSSRI